MVTKFDHDNIIHYSLDAKFRVLDCADSYQK